MSAMRVQCMQGGQMSGTKKMQQQGAQGAWQSAVSDRGRREIDGVKEASCQHMPQCRQHASSSAWQAQSMHARSSESSPLQMLTHAMRCPGSKEVKGKSKEGKRSEMCKTPNSPLLSQKCHAMFHVLLGKQCYAMCFHGLLACRLSPRHYVVFLDVIIMRLLIYEIYYAARATGDARAVRAIIIMARRTPATRHARARAQRGGVARAAQQRAARRRLIICR